MTDRKQTVNCPNCKRLFSTPQGLGMHLRHGCSLSDKKSFVLGKQPDREQLCKEFTLLTGGHWHEWKQYATYTGNQRFRCDCGANELRDKNPTYDNPADVINRLFNFLPAENWHVFIEKHGYWHEVKIQQGNDFISITKPYIPIELLIKDALLKAAVEFLREGNHDTRR